MTDQSVRSHRAMFGLFSSLRDSEDVNPGVADKNALMLTSEVSSLRLQTCHSSKLSFSERQNVGIRSVYHWTSRNIKKIIPYYIKLCLEKGVIYRPTTQGIHALIYPQNKISTKAVKVIFVK